MATHNPVAVPTKLGLSASKCRQALAYPRSTRMDRAAMLVFGMVCAVGAALVGMIQLAYAPSITTHLFVALPPVTLACLLPLWLVKGWMAKTGLKSKTR